MPYCQTALAVAQVLHHKLGSCRCTYRKTQPPAAMRTGAPGDSDLSGIWQSLLLTFCNVHSDVSPVLAGLSVQKEFNE